MSASTIPQHVLSVPMHVPLSWLVRSVVWELLKPGVSAKKLDHSGPKGNLRQPS
jgi:hypothetical protein